MQQQPNTIFLKKILNRNVTASSLFKVFRSKLAFLLDICVRGSIAVPKNQLKFKFSVRKSAAGHLRLLLRTARVCSPEFPYRYPECELYEQSHDLNNLRYYKLSESDIKWLR